MFARAGRAAFTHRKLVVLCWAILFVASIPFLLRAEEPLAVGGFSSETTEAARAREVLQTELGLNPSSLAVIFSSETLHAGDPRFLAGIREALSRVSSLPAVRSVVYPDQDRSLISANGEVAYAVVGLDLPAEEAQRSVAAFRAALLPVPELDVLVAGGPAFYADIETVSQRDLRRAELIAFPFALAALLVIFGSLVAALVPLVVGGLGVAAVLTAIYFAAQATELSIFVLNLATMLGLGLAVDYSLFITSRFREELARDPDVARALEATMERAGRAVFFSGLTVLVGLSGLVFFDFMFLHSVGVAGVIVVCFAVLAAMTLLPALLAILGPNIERGRLPRFGRAPSERESDFWRKIAERVMRRPLATLLPTLGILIALGLPFLRVEVSSPDATILPSDLPSRIGFDLLTEAFGPGEISPLVIAVRTDASMLDEPNLLALYDFARKLESDPRVERVRSIVSFDREVPRAMVPAAVSFRLGAENLGFATGSTRLIDEQTALVLAYTRSYANSDENKALLSQIRREGIGGDLELIVDGGTAEIVDVVDEMYADFPKAIMLIVAATYVVLLFLFRSLLLPLKAVVMNTLSILASYGALVWVFQEGHLDWLLRFEPLGFVEASLPIVMFCVLFGLSMDYEVFLLSRVREEWERTGDNARSVAVGLQRSGRIITSAALIVVVVTSSFVSADVILIKALGFGIALAVFLDATIVRGALVPATMRLLGNWNWWLPRALDRRLPDALSRD